jgi:hypothetical protein
VQAYGITPLENAINISVCEGDACFLFLYLKNKPKFEFPEPHNK